MTKEVFKENRDKILATCRAEVNYDGYSRIGHAMKSAVQDDPEDKGYHKSISALLVRDNRYIREPIFTKDGELKDYNILPNPTYIITQMQKWAMIATFVFSLTVIIIQIINLQMAKANQDSQKELQEQVKVLQEQVQRLQ